MYKWEYVLLKRYIRIYHMDFIRPGALRERNMIKYENCYDIRRYHI